MLYFVRIYCIRDGVWFAFELHSYSSLPESIWIEIAINGLKAIPLRIAGWIIGWLNVCQGIRHYFAIARNTRNILAIAIIMPLDDVALLSRLPSTNSNRDHYKEILSYNQRHSTCFSIPANFNIIMHTSIEFQLL